VEQFANHFYSDVMTNARSRDKMRGELDVDILARLSGGNIAVVTYYAKYIERRRKEINSDHLYSEIEQLAASIKDA
jgi:hypothetical protein